MASDSWSLRQWLEYFDGSHYPNELVVRNAPAAGGVGFIDSAEAEWLQSSIRHRAMLVTGLVLSAIARRTIGEAKPLVVVGDGPAAMFASLIAAIRGVPVLHFVTEGVQPLSPLAGCDDRWVSPHFYDQVGIEPKQGKMEWSWKVPSAFQSWAKSLEDIRRFRYWHESADLLAKRWNGQWLALKKRIPRPPHQIAISPDDLHGRGFAGVWKQIELHSARLGLPRPHLILSCRFGASEETTLRNEDDKPVFNGPRYWESGTNLSWTKTGGPVLVSGSGDGALQDFLRASWGWESLFQSRTKLLALFRQNPCTAELSAKAKKITTLFEGYDRTIETNERRRVKLRSDPNVDYRGVLKKLATEKRRFAEEFWHHVQEFAMDALKECHEAARCPLPQREVWLHSRSEFFAFGFPHNQFFALLTVAVQKRAGIDRRMIGELEFQYSGPGLDPTESAQCAAALQSGHFHIGKRADWEHVIIRHGRPRN